MWIIRSIDYDFSFVQDLYSKLTTMTTILNLFFDFLYQRRIFFKSEWTLRKENSLSEGKIEKDLLKYMDKIYNLYTI